VGWGGEDNTQSPGAGARRKDL